MSNKYRVAIIGGGANGVSVLNKKYKNVILGVTNNDGAGAAIIADGEVVAAISQERIDRVKGSNDFPLESIDCVLKIAGVTLEDIDHVTYGWSSGAENLPNYAQLYSDRLASATSEQSDIIIERLATEVRNNELRRDEFMRWATENGLADKIKLVDHHESHAFGAHACSPFEDSITISADGRGDYRSLSAYRVSKEGSVTPLFSLSTLDSWGYLYARITKLLGFKPNQHEGKITGLAGHGNPDKAKALLDLMVDPDNLTQPMRIGTYYLPNHREYSDALEAEVQKYLRPDEYGSLMQGQDVAAAAQASLEQYMINLVKKLIEENGPHNICLSGGIFANVKLNGILANLEGVKNSYILPCMGDEGHAIASAASWRLKETGQKTSMDSMKLGEELDDSNLLARVMAFDPTMKVTEYTDKIELTKFMVDQLQGETAKVIGVMRGRSEFGPRALCSNTILVSPRKEEAEYSGTVNDRLGRTEFMPFAPIVAENLASQCFEGWSPDQPNSRSMTQVYKCTDHFATTSPAVTHVDKTARPQVISEECDPFVYGLLNAWHDSTGCPSLVNTSFNNHGEPIVEYLENGLQNMKDGRVDMVIVNDRYIVAPSGMD